MNHKKISILCVLLFVFLLAGCGNKTATDIPAENPAKKLHQKHNEHADDVVAEDTDTQIVDGDHNSSEDLEISSPQGSNSNTKPSSQSENNKNGGSPAPSKKKPRSNTSFDVNEPYDANKPGLMGFTINDGQSMIVNRFGKPTGEYVIDEDYDPITVYEYPGFSIGFDHTNHVKFVEVNSNEVNPGLNGFRLGQTVNDAIKALGKPQSNTQFVIAYKSGGVVLKMDVDPNTNLIQSIKLFAENE